MSTISKMETPTGQEETAILLEEQARRIATLQESLKQAGRIHPNEAVILQERDDLRRKLENAEMLIERLKREVKELDFSVALHDRSVEKARAIWEEAHPDAEFMPCRTDLMVWLIERVERAEAVKESLTSALRDIKKNVDDWNLQDYVTIRRIVNAALRTAEESSVVGLIDGTHAKQSPNAANSDGDWDILNDIETSLRAKTDGMKRILESQPLSPELAALGRELVRLAENSLEEVEE
jgi:GGDEF domain-containing protein